MCLIASLYVVPVEITLSIKKTLLPSGIVPVVNISTSRDSFPSFFWSYIVSCGLHFRMSYTSVFVFSAILFAISNVYSAFPVCCGIGTRISPDLKMFCLTKWSATVSMAFSFFDKSSVCFNA